MLIEPGKKLPEFSCLNSEGKEINNSSLLGKKTIITVYAQDDTPSCNKQVCSVNEYIQKFEKAGYQVFGLSPDKITKHQKFMEKYKITYPLLSDPDRKTLEAFGLFGPKKFMGKDVMGVYRSAIIIDEKGIVTHFIDKVVTATHGQQLEEVLGL